MKTRIYAISHWQERHYFANKADCFRRAIQLAARSKGSEIIEVSLDTFRDPCGRDRLVTLLKSRDRDELCGTRPPQLIGRQVLMRLLGLSDVNKRGHLGPPPMPALIFKDFA